MSRPRSESVEVVLDDDTPDGGSPGAGPARDAAAPGRVRHLGRWVVVGLVLAVLVAAGLGEAHGDRGARPVPPGGVASLVVPPAERWRVDAPQGWTAAAGLLLVPERDVGGLRVHAHDLDDGARRWTLELPGAAGVECEGALEDADAGAVVVCQALGPLTPSREPGLGVVQDPGWLLLVSAVDGTLVRDVRLGPGHVGWAALEGDLVLATLGAEAGPGVDEARVAVVRTRGATATEVWSADVPVAVDRWRGGVRLTVSADVVAVAGRTAGLLTAADGSRVEIRPDAPAPGRRTRVRVTSLLSGVAVAESTGQAAPTGGRWYGADGVLRSPYRGMLAEPPAVDTGASHVLLVIEDGLLVALDGVGGSRVWDRPVTGLVPRLRAGGAVVLAGGGAATSVDLASGRERWSTQTPGLEDVTPVTDGAFALATGVVPGRGRLLTALSLTDGSVLWRTPMPPGTTGVVAAEGRLLATGGARVVGLG